MNQLTPAEIEIVTLLAKAATAFFKLPNPHPSDHTEFSLSIHTAQRHVMARATRRSHSDIFPKYP